MKIESNSFFGSSKNIEMVNSCLVAKEGPNMVSKFSLGGLDIEYDSVLTTRQTLKSGSRDTPIMYGFLGSNLTLLAIIPTYGGSNPMSCSGTSNYLEYYYEDEPLVRRTLTDILILSGDADHRIPQVYLYNPTEYTVTVDIFAANLDENEISTTLVPTYTELRGLSYSSVQSDQIYSLYGGPCTGSTQFEIYDINGNIQMVVPYNKIDIITIVNELLTIKTHSDNDIKLTFLSNFNAQQSLSKMNWVMESDINRYITAIYPGLDTTAPIISFNPHETPQPMTYTSGVVTKADIIWRFVSGVTDYDDDGYIRDGVINPLNLDLYIYKVSSGEQVSAVTIDGTYSIIFTARDVAGNSRSYTKSIVVDGVAPIIYYNSGLTSDIYYKVLLDSTSMNLYTDPVTSGTIIKDDIRRYYLNYVWDDADGIIPNSSVVVSINSGVTTYTGITQVGYYGLNFSVLDASSNECSAYTLLHVVESFAPVINYNDVFTGTTFEMSTGLTGLTESDIRAYAVSSVTDIGDGYISVDNVIVSGTTFPIVFATGYTITFSVSDSSGNETTDTKNLTAI